jgi:outer membrane protein OmpA-like peptidoglycan-associated protein
VYDYLLENGIPSERLSWKGYGNHEMRFPRATLEKEQALNRRVEIRVLEGGCE